MKIRRTIPVIIPLQYNDFRVGRGVFTPAEVPVSWKHAAPSLAFSSVTSWPEAELPPG